ncbi:MAG: hypothetical protein ACLFQ5_03865 [Oceanicaulis sp.]
MADPQKRGQAPDAHTADPDAPETTDTAANTGPKSNPGAPQPGGPGDDPAPDTPGEPGADPSKDPGPDTTPRPGPGADPKPDVRKHKAGDKPNVAQLKRDYESGAYRDKIAYPDPGASPLGTDDEAAGFPAEHERERVEMSRTATPDEDRKPFEPLQSAPRADPQHDPAPRVDTSGRFQFIVFGGVLVVIIAALIARMAFS